MQVDKWGSTAAMGVLLFVVSYGVAQEKNTPTEAAEAPAAELSPAEVAEERIRRALTQKTDVEFVEVPLDQVIHTLAKEHQIEIQLDSKALEDIGLGAEVPVSRELQGVSLRSALKLMLRPLSLTFAIRDEVLLVTTLEQVESRVLVETYPIGDLARCKIGDREINQPQRVADLVTGIVQPNTWSGVGGPGEAVAYRGLLVVLQSEDVHEEIAKLLETLRRAPALDDPKLGKSFAPLPVDGPQEIDQRWSKVLDQPIDWNFRDTPLKEVAEALTLKHKVEFELDGKALEDVGVSGDTPVTLKLKGITLRSGLRHLLRPLELTYSIQDEVLLITTPEQCEQRNVTVFYPVIDLIDLPAEATIQDIDEGLHELISLATATVAPNTWHHVGGPGHLETFPARGLLVSYQTSDVQKELAAFLTKLRKARAAQKPEERKVEAVVETKVYHLLPGKEKDGEKAKGIPPADLQEVIVRLIEPNSWAGQRDVYIKVLPDSVVVRHRRGVHRRVEALLQGLGLSITSISLDAALQGSKELRGGGFFNANDE